MTFTFSIRDALKSSWALFLTHPAFFLVLSLVMVVLNIATRFQHNTIVIIIATLAGFVWNYVWVSATLAAVDGRTDMLTLRMIPVHFPSLVQFFKFIVTGVLSGFIIIVGLILLVIPGLYFMVRLCFVTLAFVDRQGSVRQSLKYSWRLVDTHVFWKVTATIIVAILVILIGLIPLGAGLLITYPLGVLLMAHLYRALSNDEQTGEQIVVQPLEIES